MERRVIRMTLERNAAMTGLCALLCAAALVPACGPPPVSPIEATREVLEARIGPAEAGGPIYCRYDQICGSDVLPSFYRTRDFRPAWIDDGLTLADAASFLDALRLVGEDGLDPGNYHLTAIETLIAEIRASREKKRNKIGPDTCRPEMLYGRLLPLRVAPRPRPSRPGDRSV
jgi:hypothetical protein